MNKMNKRYKEAFSKKIFKWPIIRNDASVREMKIKSFVLPQNNNNGLKKKKPISVVGRNVQ